MLKKISFIIILITSVANATWDHFPILDEGSGQISTLMLYQSASDVTALDFALQSRYSLFEWLELSLGLDYRVSQEFNEDLNLDNDYGLMEFFIGSRFQFAEHWNFFLEYASVGYQYYESLVHLGFQYSRGVFGSEYGIISYRNIDSYANGRSLYDFNMELELKFFRESLFSPFIGFGFLYCIIDEWIPYNYYVEDSMNNNAGTFVLGATLNLTDEIAIDSQFMIYFGDRYINGGYKAFVFSLTYSFD